MRVTHFTDPGCPWAYSASPAHAVLRWRFGAQLEERLVMIGLTEEASQYEQRGYTPLGMARAMTRFRRWGMPLVPEVKDRVAATSPACRALVAVRLSAPERELAAFRALQFAQFTTRMLLDEPADLIAALRPVDGVDAEAVVAAIDDADIRDAYERDRAEARTAEGSPSEAQERAARTDGPVRYTAPSLIFEHGGRRLEAGGFQPLEAYDVLLANLDPRLERRPAPDGPEPVLEHFPDGVTTAEVAAILCERNASADRSAAEAALLELVAAGRAERFPLGDDGIWRLVRRRSRLRRADDGAPGRRPRAGAV